MSEFQCPVDLLNRLVILGSTVTHRIRFLIYGGVNESGDWGCQHTY